MFCCMTSSVIYTLTAHAQEPMKLLYLYELLYKFNLFWCMTKWLYKIKNIPGNLQWRHCNDQLHNPLRYNI